MRILVTGSRDWEDRLTIYRALNEARGNVPHDQIILVHGGARGVDYFAKAYAEVADWGIEEHLADWDKHGRKAGILRNIEMVDAGADICLAFIKDNSRGATHCAGYAEFKGIPVRRFRA